MKVVLPDEENVAKNLDTGFKYDTKTYCFDLDGTLCTNTDGEYEKAVPIKERRISFLNSLFDKNKIIIFTARGYTAGINWQKTTESQLNEWGIKYRLFNFRQTLCGYLY